MNIMAKRGRKPLDRGRVGKDPFFERQALGDMFPPQCYEPEDGNDGINIIRMRCKTLGLSLDKYIASFATVSRSTFYRNVENSGMKYPDILRIAVILRLNPADYMCYDHSINPRTVNSRIQRARIARLDQEEEEEGVDMTLNEYFSWDK